MAKKKISRKQLFWIFLTAWVLVSLALTFLSFSASNSIHSDYISSEPHIKALLDGQNLPDWTACRGDWLVMRLDFFFRIVLMGGLVFFTVRWLRNKSGSDE